MSKTTAEAERAATSRLWRGVAIIALMLLAASLAGGLLWFFADPLHLSPEILAALDQRASVVGMFAGMAIGVAGLVVAVLALRAQTHADRTPTADSSGTQLKVPSVSAEGEQSIVSSGDNARNVQMWAQASGQGRVYQATGDQSIHESEDHRRTYGGDHVEFHGNTFTGKVVGKQVHSPEPAAPDGSDDGPR
jgi:hypothetical protein